MQSKILRNAFNFENLAVIESEQQLSKIIADSDQYPQIIIKHSTRCGISSMILRNLEQHWEIDTLPFIVYVPSMRSISNLIAGQLDVRHESPQVLIIFKGKCIFHASHSNVRADTIAAALRKIP